MSKALVTQIQTTFETLDVDELQKLSGIPADVFNELRELGALDEFSEKGFFRQTRWWFLRKPED